MRFLLKRRTNDAMLIKRIKLADQTDAAAVALLMTILLTVIWTVTTVNRGVQFSERGKEAAFERKTENQTRFKDASLVKGALQL